MKKHIILPIIVALMSGFIPTHATTIVADEKPSKAEELNTRASWIIIFNITNNDSLDLAIKLCSEAISLDENLADAYFNRADANYFKGEYSVALKDFDIAVEKRGDAYDHQYRGETKAKLGDNEGALADFKLAAEKDFAATETGAHLAMNDANDLGIAFYNAEKYSQAVEAFNVSVNAQANKNNLFNRANAEYLSGNKSAALADWKRSGKMGNKSGRQSYRKYKKEA
jgi:tetratricopeptide (TPR) repeat protein